MLHLRQALLVAFALSATGAFLACSDESTEGGTGGGAPTTTTTTTSSSTTTTTTASGGSGGGGAEGGSGGVGGSGGAGGSACVPVTVGEYMDVLTQTDPYGGSNLIYTLDGLDPNGDNELWIEFYDLGAAQVAGDIALGVDPDDNYDSCSHCVLAYEDDFLYFAASGTMHLTEADTGYTGASSGSFENVELVEVTLEGENGTTTVPVPNGRCLLLNGSWDNTP